MNLTQPHRTLSGAVHHETYIPRGTARCTLANPGLPALRPPGARMANLQGRVYDPARPETPGWGGNSQLTFEFDDDRLERLSTQILRQVLVRIEEQGLS